MSYTPPLRPSDPVVLRVCSSRRARLFAGGTYFRARDPGRGGNNIKVEIIEVDGEGYCVITNDNLKFDENVIGATPKLLEVSGTYADLWIVDRLDVSPRTQTYRTSLRIAFQRRMGLPHELPTPSATTSFAFEKMFSEPGKLSVLLQKSDVVFTPTDRIIIAPRTRIYQLAAVTKTTPADPEAGTLETSTTGWSIENLRTQINAADPWIEMLERSGPTPGLDGAPPIPNPNPVDAQDPGLDSNFLTPFSSMNLENGDGLPADPSAERTGPSKAIVLVNFGELQNGTLGEVNAIYEWVGDSASAGTWKKT